MSEFQSKKTESRELAAIMFTDIVGYTALMGEDEELAFKLLDKNREIHNELVTKYNGVCNKELGDGILCSFSTIFNAVNCALAIQEAYDSMPELELKIGIHQAEVVYKENDVFGDGVNIASRIQAIAPPGGVYISEPVFRNISNKKGLRSDFVGEKKFKNVKHSIKIYDVDSSSKPRKNPASKKDENMDADYQNQDIQKNTSGANGKSRNKIYTWITLSFILILLGIFAYPSILNALLPKPSICVFFPNPEKPEISSFYQDGEEQYKGFKDALETTGNLPNRLNVYYEKMDIGIQGDSILELMKKNYKELGATYFVMTMSSKIGLVREHFIEWHNSCVDKRRREPILIATVASAPDIAEIKSGIIRWYIRSKEESEELAEHLYKVHNVSDAAVFYITKDGDLHDPYGTSGKDFFVSQFKVKGNIIDNYPTRSGTAEKNVSDFLSDVRSPEYDYQEKYCGAYVVGYGDMVTTVIKALEEKGFLGQVASSSTLTEGEWQPKNTNLDEQICTILPKVKDPTDELKGKEKNVVYFFSREALKHVLEITSLDPKSKNFISHWQENPPAGDRLDQEMISNGDCLIKLEVVEHKEWRQDKE